MVKTIEHDGIQYPRTNYNHDLPKRTLQADEALGEAFKHVTEWGMAVDGGVYAGLWSLMLAKRFTSVIGFEPIEANYDIAIGNTKDVDNIKLINSALGGEDGVLTMSIEGAHFGKASNKGKEYPMTCIDTLDLKDVGLIKLDLEGIDLQGLEGAAKTIAENSPVIIIETKNQEALIAKWMDDHDYLEVWARKPDKIYTRKG